MNHNLSSTLKIVPACCAARESSRTPMRSGERAFSLGKSSCLCHRFWLAWLTSVVHALRSTNATLTYLLRNTQIESTHAIERESIRGGQKRRQITLWFTRQGEKPMAIQYDEHRERIILEEFYALLERDPEHCYELIDGYPYMMTGGPPDHSIIGANLTGIFREQLRKRPCIAYNSDMYIKLDGEENCLCPDASVTCDRRDRHATKVIRHPCIVAEVLSPGTKARDRGLRLICTRGCHPCKKFFLSIPQSREYSFTGARQIAGSCATSHTTTTLLHGPAWTFNSPLQRRMKRPPLTDHSQKSHEPRGLQESEKHHGQQDTTGRADHKPAIEALHKYRTCRRTEKPHPFFGILSLLTFRLFCLNRPGKWPHAVL